MVSDDDLKSLVPGKDLGYAIAYRLYKSDNDKIEIPDNTYKTISADTKAVTHSVCFADIGRFMSENPNRLLLHLGRIRDVLSKNDVLKFFDICKKHNALPEYINEECVDKKGAVIRLDSKVSPSLLYVYLCVLRMAEEQPGFTTNMLKLYEMGLPFSICWVIASAVSISNSWHNIVSISRDTAGRAYTDREWNAFKVKELNVSVAVAIQRYFKNPALFDKRCLVNMSDYADHGFECEQHILASSALPRVNATSKQLVHELLCKAVDAENDDESAKLIYKWKNGA